MNAKDKQRNEIADLEMKLKLARRYFREEKAKTAALQKEVNDLNTTGGDLIIEVVCIRSEIKKLKAECEPDRTVSTQWLEVRCNEVLRVGRSVSDES